MTAVALSPASARANGWRWRLAAVLMLVSVVNFLDRAALGAVAPQIQAEFHLDTRGYQSIVNAFLLAFTLSFALGGFLVDRFGPRKSLAVSLSLWSVAAMAHGVAATSTQLALCRAVLGLGEGLFWPSALRAAAEWFEPRDRGRPIGLATAGAGFGMALAPFVLATGSWLGWRGGLAVIGALGLLVLPLWMMATAAPPSLTDGREEVQDTADAPPLSATLRTRAFATLLSADFLAAAVYSLLIFYLVLFLERERGIAALTVARVAWIPFIFLDIGAVCGGLLTRGADPDCDILLARKRVLVAAACLTSGFLMAYYAPPSLGLALLVPLCLACLGYGAIMANLIVLYSDVVPKIHLGKAAGIAGASGNLSAILIGSVVAVAVDRTHTYLPVLLACSLLPLLAAFLITRGLSR
jgi:ACS family hexuronate transporter-like MFS transporter